MYLKSVGQRILKLASCERVGREMLFGGGDDGVGRRRICRLREEPATAILSFLLSFSLSRSRLSVL